jgi:hypothetical protein
MNVAVKSEADRKAMNFAMNLSLGIGLLMFLMKMGAYLLTGSAAILSGAAECVVHVAAVIFAAYSLRLSYRPADEDHRIATDIERVIEVSLEPRAYVTKHLECASDHELLRPHEQIGKAQARS